MAVDGTGRPGTPIQGQARPDPATTRENNRYAEENRERAALTAAAGPVNVDRVPWSVLGPDFIRAWGYPRGKRQPEHLEILGQTGSGKSFFEKTVLQQRVAARGSHVVVIATKPADATLTSMGWPVITRWPPDYGKNQVIFWAKGGLSKDSQEKQREAILDVLGRLWQPDSNRIVVFDEISYLAVDLGLKTELTTYFREARALGITIVSSTQRPQGVPRWMHSEASWTVCFAPKDEEDAERMAQVLGGKKTYMPILQTLNRARYEFLIVHGLTGEFVISWIDRTRPVKASREDARKRTG